MNLSTVKIPIIMITVYFKATPILLQLTQTKFQPTTTTKISKSTTNNRHNSSNKDSLNTTIIITITNSRIMDYHTQIISKEESQHKYKQNRLLPMMDLIYKISTEQKKFSLLQNNQYLQMMDLVIKILWEAVSSQFNSNNSNTTMITRTIKTNISRIISSMTIMTILNKTTIISNSSITTIKTTTNNNNNLTIITITTNSSSKIIIIHNNQKPLSSNSPQLKKRNGVIKTLSMEVRRNSRRQFKKQLSKSLTKITLLMLEQERINLINHQWQTNHTKTTTIIISNNRIITKLNQREILTNNNQVNNLRTLKATKIINQLRETIT